MTGAKGLLKRLVVGVSRQIMVPGTSSRVVVLCYHSVHSTRSFASVTPELFEKHLIWLRGRCEIISFSDVSGIASDTRGNRPLVAVTLDDGYADNYECAFPLLQSYQVPATFFLTVGFVERDPAVIERFRVLRRASVEELRPLTWSQVRVMRQAGMEFGAHTYSHPNLARLDRTAAEAELRRAKDIMEDRLGQRVSSMAYPFGRPKRHFTMETMDIVSRIGYEYAAATTSRAVRLSDSHFAIPRFFATGASVSALEDITLGAWDILGYWQERAPVFLLSRGH